MKCGKLSAFPDLISLITFIHTLASVLGSGPANVFNHETYQKSPRTSMGDEGLANLCLISIEHDMSRHLLLHPENDVDYFAQSAKRRMQLL